MWARLWMCVLLAGCADTPSVCAPPPGLANPEFVSFFVDDGSGRIVIFLDAPADPTITLDDPLVTDVTSTQTLSLTKNTDGSAGPSRPFAGHTGDEAHFLFGPKFCRFSACVIVREGRATSTDVCPGP